MTAKTVIVTGARAPVALHLARLFHVAGHHVILADTMHYPLARATRCKSGYIKLPSPTQNFDIYATAWRDVLDRFHPDMVLATCEDVFYVAAVRDIARVAVPLFAPSLETLTRVHNKYRFVALAAGCGADAPQTHQLTAAAQLIDLPREIVLKPVWSRFGSETLIKPDKRELARCRPTEASPWVAQSFLPGEELCACAIAIDGTVRAVQTYRPLWRAGLGAAVAFAPVAEATIASFVAAFCAKLRWTGPIAFDFKRDNAGALHVIECNPRPTSGLHFFGADDGLAAAILGEARATASLTTPLTLPLAFATYGLGQALRGRRLAEWWRDARRLQDLAAWPGDGHLFGAQVLALAEIAVLSLRKRKGLRAAVTDDIEWNGTGFGS